MIKEYEGIVIKSINYKENDKILHIFTKESGKLSCMARGVRKINKKSETNVDLFSHSTYNLYKGRGFYHVNQSERLNSFFDLREDLEKLSYASYILELVDTGMMEEEENETVFNLLIKTLEVLSDEKADAKKLLIAFQLKFISFIGYKPELRNCLYCGEGDISLLSGLSISNGGVLCNQCRGINKQDYIRDLSESSITILRKLLYSRLDCLKDIEVSPHEMKKVGELAEVYTFEHLDKSYFKSLELLKTLNLI